MTGIFGILESSATQWYQDADSTQEFFFFIVTSIVYGQYLSFNKWVVQPRNARELRQDTNFKPGFQIAIP
jgi:hypothetical protein